MNVQSYIDSQSLDENSVSHSYQLCKELSDNIKKDDLSNTLLSFKNIIHHNIRVKAIYQGMDNQIQDQKDFEIPQLNVNYYQKIQDLDQQQKIQKEKKIEEEIIQQKSKQVQGQPATEIYGQLKEKNQIPTQTTDVIKTQQESQNNQIQPPMNKEELKQNDQTSSYNPSASQQVVTQPYKINQNIQQPLYQVPPLVQNQQNNIEQQQQQYQQQNNGPKPMGDYTRNNFGVNNDQNPNKIPSQQNTIQQQQQQYQQHNNGLKTIGDHTGAQIPSYNSKRINNYTNIDYSKNNQNKLQFQQNQFQNQFQSFMQQQTPFVNNNINTVNLDQNFQFQNDQFKLNQQQNQQQTNVYSNNNQVNNPNNSLNNNNNFVQQQNSLVQGFQQYNQQQPFVPQQNVPKPSYNYQNQASLFPQVVQNNNNNNQVFNQSYDQNETFSQVSQQPKIQQVNNQLDNTLMYNETPRAQYSFNKQTPENKQLFQKIMNGFECLQEKQIWDIIEKHKGNESECINEINNLY